MFDPIKHLPSIGEKYMFTSKKSRRVLVLATAVVGSLVASILPASAENAAPKGDLVLVRNQDFATFNPDLAQNDSIFPQQQIFEPLYMISQDGKTVSPWLAKSSSQAADKLTWTIKLRTDVKFSDGTPMTSADVKFSLDLATKGDGWGFLNTAIDTITWTTANTF